VSRTAKRKAIIENLASALRDERLRLGLSQSEMAVRAGIDRTMILRVEKGARIPTIDTLLRMTEALDVNLATFLQRAMKAVGP